MNTETIRTLIVDDHAVVRSGYRTYLREVPGFDVVAEAENADDAYAQYKRFRPDVVIMDIMMQGASGIDASRRILSHHPGAKILIFSMYASPALLHQALDVGVLGAVGKQCDPDTLRAATIAVSRGERYLDGSTAQSLVFSKYDRDREVLGSLSPREFEIFLMLVSGASGDETARALSLSAKTIANRISMIRQKLGVSSDVELIKLAAMANIVPWIRPFAASGN